MPSLRCPDCLADWPTTSEYSVCPRCRIRCDRMTGTTAMLQAEAKSEVNRIKFERHYAEYDAKREKRGDPTPEQIGAIEAREIYKLEQILHHNK